MAKIVHEDGTEGMVKFSRTFIALIGSGVLAGGAATGGVGLLNWRMAQAEERVEKVETRQKVDEQNIRTVDRELRAVQQEAQHNGRKLDALLEANGVTRRIERPPLPPSQIREVPE